MCKVDYKRLVFLPKPKRSICTPERVMRKRVTSNENKKVRISKTPAKTKRTVVRLIKFNKRTARSRKTITITVVKKFKKRKRRNELVFVVKPTNFATEETKIAGLDFATHRPTRSSSDDESTTSLADSKSTAVSRERSRFATTDDRRGDDRFQHAKSDRATSAEVPMMDFKSVETTNAKTTGVQTERVLVVSESKVKSLLDAIEKLRKMFPESNTSRTIEQQMTAVMNGIDLASPSGQITTDGAQKKCRPTKTGMTATSGCPAPLRTANTIRRKRPLQTTGKSSKAAPV